MSKAADWASASDEALVLEYQRDPIGPRGRDAAEQLVARWSTRAFTWAYRMVREREQAMDLAQDALLQMYQALPRYEARGRFSAWIFTIVHNRCLSAVRRRPLTRDPELDTDDLATEGQGPEEWFQSAEDRGRLVEAMDQSLDANERAAIWLRAYEGMSVDDITRLLSLDGASGARGVLQTARRKLRAALARTG